MDLIRDNTTARPSPPLTGGVAAASTAATAALILDSLPAQSLAGIDLLSFTTSSRFRGVRQIPPGWHFVFVAAAAAASPSSASVEVSANVLLGAWSVRQGVWFYVPLPPPTSSSSSASARDEGVSVTVLQWDPRNEILVPETDDLALMRWRANLGAVWGTGLTPYRQTSSSSSHLSPPLHGPQSSLSRVVDADLDDDVDVDDQIENNVDPDDDVNEDDPESDDNDWRFLTSHITSQVLSRILPGSSGSEPLKPSSSSSTTTWRMTSTSSSAVDVEAMTDLVAVRSSPSSSSRSRSKFTNGQNYTTAGHDEDDPTLHLLPIDLRQTWAPGTTGRARSTAAQDRTWALNHLVETHCSGIISEILGELEFCFLMTVTLSNASCADQWMRLLRLLLTCVEATRSHAEFFVNVLAALKRQVRVARANASDDVLELLDLLDPEGSELKTLLVRFRKGVDSLRNDASASIRREGGGDVEMVRKEFSLLENFLRRECGWEFENPITSAKAAATASIGPMGFLLDEESGINNRVDTAQTLAAIVDLDYDNDDEEEETGEFAPTVVDLTEEQAKLLDVERVTISGRGKSTLEQTLLHEEEEEAEAEESDSDTHHELNDNEDDKITVDEDESGEDSQELEDMDERF